MDALCVQVNACMANFVHGRHPCRGKEEMEKIYKKRLQKRSRQKEIVVYRELG